MTDWRWPYKFLGWWYMKVWLLSFLTILTTSWQILGVWLVSTTSDVHEAHNTSNILIYLKFFLNLYLCIKFLFDIFLFMFLFGVCISSFSFSNNWIIIYILIITAIQYTKKEFNNYIIWLQFHYNFQPKKINYNSLIVSVVCMGSVREPLKHRRRKKEEKGTCVFLFAY